MTKQYAERDICALDEAGNHYSRHVSAMTSEGLHSKSDIAAELGYRDHIIETLVARCNELLSERIRIGPDIDAAISNGVIPESHPFKSRLEMLANYHKREADLASKLNTAELTLDEADRVISELVRNGAYGLDDLLDEVGSCLRKLQDGAV